MAAPDGNSNIITALIAALGTAQAERDDGRLHPASAPLDDRDTAALLGSLRALAPLIRHYANSPEEPPGDWRSFFPAEALGTLLQQQGEGRLAPHLGLLIAFLRLLARPQARATARWA